MIAPVPRRRRPNLDRQLKSAAKFGLRVTSIKIGVDGSIELLTSNSPAAEVDAFASWKAAYDARPAQGNRHSARSVS